MCIYIYIYIHTCIYVCVCVCVCVYVYIYIYVYVCTYIYIYICIHTYRHTNGVPPRKKGVATGNHSRYPAICKAGHTVIVAIFYPFSQFCEIGVSLPSLQKQPKTASNLFQRGVEYGKYVCESNNITNYWEDRAEYDGQRSVCGASVQT